MESKQKQIAEAVNVLSIRLKTLDVTSLAISEYNQNYLKKYIFDFAFYMPLYSQLLLKAIDKLNKPVAESTFVDYGGGCGMLSFLASVIGFKTVIYTDIYQVSVDDAQGIARELGIAVDHFWCGDIDVVVEQINRNDIQPDLICSVDVLEHIYNLDEWFTTLGKVKADFSLLFMTSANSKNPYVVRRIKKMQLLAEYRGVKKTFGWKERDANGSFLAEREKIIRNEFPMLDEAVVKLLATKTRGLRKDDIEKFVKDYQISGKFGFQLKHPTNTCDPYSGNWVEHLIDLRELRQLIGRKNMSIELTNSFYAYSSNKILNVPKLLLNVLLRLFGKRCLFLSHTYTLEVQRS